jgi:cation:H+ antiporter
MAAAAWFTRRLEAICDRLDLSAGVLSILGALGANIPNYVASIDAIASGKTEVGLGIIIGSNIYNIAIILGLATFVTSTPKELRFSLVETRQVKSVGGYALAVMLATLLVVWLLPQKMFWPTFSASPLAIWLLYAGMLAELGIFAAFVWHIVHRPHPAPTEPHQKEASSTQRLPLRRLISEAVLALAVALGGVIVMVQTGQDLTSAMHMAPALAGLLVLAVATSLPNTVVAISLVRTGRAAACAEEIFSSNSVNAALGIALPLLFWRQSLRDPLLLIWDLPLMILLTLWALACSRRGKVSRYVGLGLLLSYVLWVGIHLFV